MSDDLISEKIREFIFSHVDSVGSLEVLILFKKNPEKEWSAKTLSDELRTNPLWGNRQIQWWLSKSHIEESAQKDFYRYKIKSPEVDQIIADLTKAYSQKRIAVISLISDRLVRVKEFADAFVIQKGDKDG